MTILKNAAAAIAVAVAFVVSVGAVATTPAAFAEETHVEYAVARGGLLYDRWLKVTEGYELPRDTHPKYPSDGKLSKKSTWLCWSCHGWDYKGKDGATEAAHGSILGAKGKPAAEIIAILKDGNHGFKDGMLSERDFNDMAHFVSSGVIDMDPYIDRQSGKSKGDVAKGRAYYDTICTRCHGMDGKKEATLGSRAKENPWQVFHKIRNGQPMKEMPALFALDPQISADILAYAQQLPD